MSKLIFLLFLFVGPAELRSRVRLPPPPSPEEAHLGRGEDASEVPGASRDVAPRRREDPSWYFTTPRVTSTSALRPNSSTSSSSSSSGPPPPPPLLFPVADGSYWAYALMLLALSLFSVGMVGNLALMCTVWHNAYLQSAWNCILAGLAFLDFLVLFFCLPVVVFHELTFRRLLGGASCRLVPYLEVTSLGVATFSLCALSIDRFHAATSPTPGPAPRVESCRSILSKMAVIWLGSLVLATPEVLLWQLRREPVGPPELVWWREAVGPGGASLAVDMCVREPSAELPDSVYSLVLTYQEARTWWMIGCYVCLPLLFTLACDLVTQRVSAHQPAKAASRCSSSSASSCVSSSLMKKKRHHHHHHHHHHHQHHHAQEPKLRSTVMWLTALYVACNIPDSACSIALAYVEAPVTVVAASGLAGHFFLFARCAATPVLLLCLCRSLGQAFLDCCCCCCDECLPDASSSASTATSGLSSPSPTSSMPSARDDASQAIGTPC